MKSRSEYKVGDLVTNYNFCEQKPFKLTNSHFRGVTARNEEWFNSLMLWTPKVGEWVIPDTGVYEDMFVVMKYNGISLIPNRCQPFIGELPEMSKK